MSGAEHTKATTVDTTPTVWGLYNDKAKFRDKVLMKDWDSSINSLLLFAAIFAAVLTALCVESRKLLEPDPLNLIDQTLLYMVQRSINPSIAPPPPRQPFEPPQWAVLVNGFFFTSLTTSILAAVAAVTCMQWVEEYDAGVEAAATPKERAIRSHYRYRATERWYMRHMIASLPILLYLAVGFFFIGLVLWFWQIYWMLAFIPLTGFSIWAAGYTATTLMAVFYPSAPYRTAVSKALFRVLYRSQFYAWDRTRTIISLYRPLLKFLRHFFSRDPWNESRNQYILEKIEFSREMKLKLLDHFPWMPPGRDVHQSMHSHIREQGCVALDETIHISTLAWLASSIDLSEDSVPKLHLVLAELNNLPESKLKHWQEHNYDAPWSHIFKMVLTPSTLNKTESGENRDGASIQSSNALRDNSIIPTLAQILQKMSLHPTLFERMILELDNRLLLEFMDLLKSKRPTSSTDAHHRLQSITLLVSSKKWMSISQEEQPIMSTFRVILDCLDSMHITDGGSHISTSWIFTFCYVKTVNGGDRNVVTWPKPALIKFIPDAFTNKNLREHAIILVLQFIDAIFCDSDPAASTKWRWKWSKNSVSRLADRLAANEPGLGKPAAEKLAAERHASDKLVIMRLLVHHLLRIFFTFSESQQSQALFNDLLSRDRDGGEGITSPALRLVIMAFGGHQKEVEVPQDNDPVWNDPVWLYAVSVWFGFRVDYAVSNGDEIFDLVNPQESAKLVDAFRRVDPLAFIRLIKLSTRLRSSRYLRFWIRLFKLAPNSEREISQTLSSPLAGLQPDQWFQIYTEFQSKEGPCTPNRVTIAMLQALGGSVRTAFCRQLWRKYIDTYTQASPSAQSTPLARLVQLVMDVLRVDRPNRQPGSLPLGMLQLTRNFIRNYRNNANFERLQICVYIVDALAMAYRPYTDGSMRDTRYSDLFREISRALRHIYRPPVRRIGSSIAPLKVPADEDPIWLKKLEATCRNTEEAGGRHLEVDKLRIPLASGVERKGTAQDTPVKEGVLHRILGRTPTVTREDKV